ncbi:unnamed protein product [Trichobilharzia szidati]|nr:unnamed protein product [Trichobilharzia szidati]
MSLKVLLTTVYVVSIFLCNNQVTPTGIHSVHYYGFNTPMEIEHRYDADLFFKGTETSPNNITEVTTNEAVNKSSKNIRLPQTVFPHFYDLRLQVHIHENADTKDFYFNGSVTIKIQCLAATADLFIHAYPNLNVSTDQIKIFPDDKEDVKKSEIPIQTISYDKDAEWYHIQLKEALQPNASYKLIFGQFNSSLNYEPVGFYLSRYAENGTYKYLASTQFESTYARRVFPCWDEPGFKAVFQFTVWTRPEKIESARYALDIGRRILTYFENYFGVPYPLPKMDMVAIPNFKSNAMENWGLITFRESALFWNPYTGSAASKEWVTIVIAHELAHQWFGNLVTMKWWNNLWLNEGFASFLEYTGTDFVQPDWKLDERFIFSDLQRAMISDASIQSHPIINSAEYPAEIEDIFDPITYSKGASIIRMMESFLGHDVFLNGLKAAKSANKVIDIKSIMDTWTKQANYPILIVNRSDSSTFHFKQIHFYEPVNDSILPSGHNFTWKIPITYTTKDGTASEIIWMNNATLKMKLNVMPNDWYIINIGQIGYYRVHYVDNNCELLTDELLKNVKNIPDSARPQIIGDLFHLANLIILFILSPVNSEYTFHSIPPGLKSAVYCTAIRFGGQAEWKFLRSQYSVNETDDVEKENILTGLSCSRDIWTMKLDEFTKEVIQSLSNPYYSLNNKNDGEKILSTEADWLQLPQNHPLKRGLYNLLTTSKRNLKWLDTHLHTIVQWLKENVPHTAQEV